MKTKKSKKFSTKNEAKKYLEKILKKWSWWNKHEKIRQAILKILEGEDNER